MSEAEKSEVKAGTPSPERLGSATLEQWETYRAEMIGVEKGLHDIAKRYLDLRAYKEAAECAMRADAMKFLIGRMPNTEGQTRGGSRVV